jgi:Zn-dependent peptidase ImmA (M78 family)
MNKVTLGLRSGVNTKSIRDYESGRVVPSDDSLEAIASVLRFPVSFFYRNDLEEPSEHGVSFRSLKSMTAGQRDAALASGALAFELSQWIDTQFELQAPDLPDLREYGPTDAALALRNHWGIGIRPIGNMIGLLEAKGVRVFSLSERSKQVDAFSLWYRNLPFVFLNTMKTPEHSRMDAAHELGHLVLHRHGAPRGRDVEKDAQAFGSAFLMPRESIVGVVPKLVAPTVQYLAQLKRNWGVSVSALAHRLHQLGLLTDWAYRGIYIELSKYGRTREPNGMERETSQVLAKVFGLLKESGTTKADVARRLDLYTEDLDALIFGLSITPVSEMNRSAPDASAEERRRGFRVV